MKKLLLLLCFFCSIGSVFSQTEESDSTAGDDEFVLVIPPINEQLKVGVKLGTGAGMMLGNELQNPRPKYMISGGAYLRYRFSKRWSIQPEANITFKGSNFKNGDGQYESISGYAVDIPVLLMVGLTPENRVNVFAGMQYSRTLGRSLYLKGSLVPDDSSLGMHRDDWAAVVGSQFQTPFVGFQVAVKYGLRDLNTGLTPTLNPPNTGKDIHQAVLEINILF
jgi:hypothetical protein